MKAYHLQGEISKCKKCGGSMIKKNTRKIYCDDCIEDRIRTRNRNHHRNRVANRAS